MDEEFITPVDLLEQRLALMRELASSLANVQGAVLRSDLEGMEGHTARQQELCQALHALEVEAWRHLPGVTNVNGCRSQKLKMNLPEEMVSAPLRERWIRTVQELREVESRVRHLNQVYGGLLRRAERTLLIFHRVLAGPSTTYAPGQRESTTTAPAAFEENHV